VEYIIVFIKRWQSEAVVGISYCLQVTFFYQFITELVVRQRRQVFIENNNLKLI